MRRRPLVRPIWLLSLCCFLLAGCEAKPHVQWEKYTPELMAEARSSGQPILAYFYAAWCPPCYELKEKTFSDPYVIEALAPFRKIKVDMSYKHSAKTKALGQEYRVDALPTLLFFTPEGDWSKTPRLRGYVSAEQFLEVLSYYQSRHPYLVLRSN